ncbi:toll/interleukin-1 receptor domain-containing protein [Halomicronema sp. CCY15110]|uniref:toll/interleukin-1 receptor domain-containing protein n=1 Tax=Halomicronema sp. CCY15110 TaxID=2767773 RepID=UPI00194F2FE8|nr:toll/interleukin-1 receptor domain-containing protein [Halomicronema sp. CCY15110]
MTAAPTPKAYAYDVFISYSTQDKAWVRGELLQTLEAAGLRVGIDFRDFRPGAATITEIERLAETSERTLLILSPAYMESEWTDFETILLQTFDPANKKLRMIPLRKAVCEIPKRLKVFTYVDFAEPDDLELAWTRVLTALGKPPQVKAADQPATPRDWFLAHPYGMPPNFTGREAELGMLDEWLAGAGTPALLMLRALGGFGKSALTWHWLTKRVDAGQWPQVVWWSFYETSASFDAFLRVTLTYVTGREPEGGKREQLAQLLGLLQERRVLLVLDGFERELRAYSGLGAAYQGDEPILRAEESPSPPVTDPKLGEGGRPSPPAPLPKLREGGTDAGRDCVNPLAEDFLRGVASLPGVRGRVLMSTRLRPKAVEVSGGLLLQGCREVALTQLQPEDAVAFFGKQGIRGTRGEIAQICGAYGYHPLSLRLLAGFILDDFEYPGDVQAAASLDLTGDLVQRRNHVLARSYENLSAAARQLLGRIACFRGPVQIVVLEQVGDAVGAHGRAPLQGLLRDLVTRGLLQFDGPTRRFDLHPIVRRYAYDRLARPERTAAHAQLRDYFEAVPPPERVETLADLEPVIELYHHQVRAGQYDEARVLFRDRLNQATYYQLGAYQLQIELLRALFPQGEDQPPQLQDEGAQGWTLNELANSYSLSGLPAKAVPLFERDAEISERRADKKNWAIALGNLAYMAQLPIGALQAAEANLRRSIAICQEIEDEFWEAVAHQELGRLLAYRGLWAESAAELDQALAMFEQQKHVQAQGNVWAYRSLAALLQHRAGATAAAAPALAAAQRALDLADEWTRTQFPLERDYVQAHWLLGAAHRVNGDLAQSDGHLSEALTRCRTINLVEFEADILLDLARLRVDQGQGDAALRQAQAALLITERSGYVLKEADVRLCLAQQALAQGDGAAALGHARAARELARCDGGEWVYRVAFDEAGALGVAG